MRCGENGVDVPGTAWIASIIEKYPFDAFCVALATGLPTELSTYPQSSPTLAPIAVQIPLKDVNDAPHPIMLITRSFEPVPFPVGVVMLVVFVL